MIVARVLTPATLETQPLLSGPSPNHKTTGWLSAQLPSLVLSNKVPLQGTCQTHHLLWSYPNSGEMFAFPFTVASQTNHPILSSKSPSTNTPLWETQVRQRGAHVECFYSIFQSIIDKNSNNIEILNISNTIFPPVQVSILWGNKNTPRKMRWSSSIATPLRVKSVHYTLSYDTNTHM
jgi:hypothetical protein